ncbi:peptidyl-prolyl cis-trans isomerase C [Salinihabitans flavidus]|uniref:Parvulin-like PPIase n=1 Tax=Salinihabitans flavidus TaxID=569882 RepID=A0A1H8LV91_9RHOB|nr:peptidylprolyl isomerase [Salinihabitans flavidus]SEO09013.1 peptidyl-prolyl cis-trans isomerase C [Salinihabitans flavidus]
MSKQLRFLWIAIFSVFLATPTLADETADADTVVATINGDEITLGQMILVRNSLPDQYDQLADDVLFDGILNQLVQQAVLAQSFTGDPPRRVELALENERRSLLAAEAVENLLGDSITDEAVQSYYDDKYVDFEGGREFNASHILVETEEEAAAIRSEIVNDGAEFSAMAEEKSTGPSGPSGGKLGWFGPGQMVQPFEEALKELEVGEVSDPVQTQFGWHLILLNETRLQEAPVLEDVRDEIVAEMQKQAVDDRIAELTEAADIDRSGAQSIDDPTVLKNIGLLEN